LTNRNLKRKRSTTNIKLQKQHAFHKEESFGKVFR